MDDRGRNGLYCQRLAVANGLSVLFRFGIDFGMLTHPFRGGAGIAD